MDLTKLQTIDLLKKYPVKRKENLVKIANSLGIETIDASKQKTTCAIFLVKIEDCLKSMPDLEARVREIAIEMIEDSNSNKQIGTPNLEKSPIRTVNIPSTADNQPPSSPSTLDTHPPPSLPTVIVDSPPADIDNEETMDLSSPSTAKTKEDDDDGDLKRKLFLDPNDEGKRQLWKCVLFISMGMMMFFA